MCGIFGATGPNALADTLSALKLLEYRGYDSAGVCYDSDGKLIVEKTTARVETLANKLCGESSFAAIGHTRWATHGEATEANAHPFLSFDGKFAMAHNGIIENHAELRKNLERVGISFSSSTDSEVAVHLFAAEYNGDALCAMRKVASALKGSFALVFIGKDGIYAMRRGSPLCVGKSGGKLYVCSDINTLRAFAGSIAVLPDDCFLTLKGGKSEAFDGVKKIPLNFFAAEKLPLGQKCDGDFMMKEISEIPERMRDTFSYYFQSGGLALPKALVKKFSRVYFIGCGTAYHSGMAAAEIFRKYCNLDAFAVIASEYVCGYFPTDGRTLAIFVSQSGETADTVAAAKVARQKGATSCAVTNVANSSLCRTVDFVKYIRAGAEIAVASTKAYNCQIVTLTLMALDFACARNCMSFAERQRLLNCFDALPSATKRVLNGKRRIEQLANELIGSTAVFFLGRRADLPTAMEGSLKLKEVSYVHSEAYPSGELKHGTLALVEEGVSAIAIATERQLAAKCANAVREVGCRGAKTVVISQYSAEASDGKADYVFDLPVVADLYYPALAVVPLQLFAYYFAKLRGCDVDKPRNLAKSVTVE